MFSDGLAAVKKDGKIGFINKKNEIVIPFMYDYFNNMEYIAGYNNDGDEVYVLSDEFIKYYSDGFQLSSKSMSQLALTSKISL